MAEFGPSLAHYSKKALLGWREICSPWIRLFSQIPWLRSFAGHFAESANASLRGGLDFESSPHARAVTNSTPPEIW
jgi:hypothetical protein